MSFSWTQHRFSGGALALDIANSVILRGDAARSVDRFAEPANLKSFAHAFSVLARSHRQLFSCIRSQAS
jgi:predicted RNA-binding Zn ribbon-like protein